ncbi:MAG: ABC transporter permease, partial [Desulfomonile sp.]|nr:ABC transporter permease [Desulfomonile sp.]
MRFLPFDYGVRNLGRSRTRLCATVAASALVVTLVIAAAGFVRGMARALVVTEECANVMLIAAGSEESVERSQIARNAADLVAAGVSGIKTTLGVPHVSPEIHAALIVRPDRESSRELRTVMRGFTPEAFLVHQRVQIVDGRMPQPGKDEIMVGGLAAEMMGLPEEFLSTGRKIWFDNRQWTIVGRFRAPGTVMDAEVWVPLTDMQVAMKRDTISCVVLTLGEADFSDVDAFTKMRFDLGLVAIKESDYFASILKFYRPVEFMIWSTALLVALTGLLGGLNTMYAAFAARKREFGMLQSLGYPRRAILLALIQESLLVAAAGTLLASALSTVLIDGHAVRFSMGVFQVIIDHRVLLVGMFAGLSIGVFGALP